MSEQEMVKRDIDTLKESIARDWSDLQNLTLTKEEAAGIREHIRLCESDLKKLRERLDRLPKNSN